VVLLAELGQGLIALTVSALTAYWIGATYAVVGLVVLLTCFVLLAQTAHQQALARPLSEAQPGFVRTTSSIMLTSLALGGVWPAIPLIFAWGAWRDRARDDRPDAN
jgi:hypothetical protein